MFEEHKLSYAVVIVVTFLVYIATSIIYGLCLWRTSGVTDIYVNATNELDRDEFYTELTPAGWTLAIWVATYLCQMLWLGYALSTICRRITYGYLYVNPGHLPQAMYMTFILNLISIVAWLVFWKRRQSEFALIFAVLAVFVIYVCLGISFRRLHALCPVFMREESAADIWLTRGLLHNGMASYATMLTIACLINFAVVLNYNAAVSTAIAGTASLCLVLLLVFIWFLLDNFVFDKYVRYTFSPYALIIISMIGVIDRHWEAESTNSVLAAFILAVGILALVVKILMTTWRHRHSPLHQELFFYRRPQQYGAIDYENVVVT